ncbi:MAG: hypothetical protein IPK13_02350 [Deltaproteobacteria bacterium]|nr:hypothetical protein [Deltaproteobacteria bacterium]
MEQPTVPNLRASVGRNGGGRTTEAEAAAKAATPGPLSSTEAGEVPSSLQGLRNARDEIARLAAERRRGGDSIPSEARPVDRADAESTPSSESDPLEAIVQRALADEGRPFPDDVLDALRDALRHDMANIPAETSDQGRATALARLEDDARAFLEISRPREPMGVQGVMAKTIEEARKGSTSEALEPALHPIIEAMIAANALTPERAADARNVVLPTLARWVRERARSGDNSEPAEQAAELVKKLGVYVTSRYPSHDSQPAPAPTRVQKTFGGAQAQIESKIELCLEQQARIRASSRSTGFLVAQHASTLESLIEHVEAQQHFALTSTTRHLVRDLFGRLLATVNASRQSWTTTEDLADTLRDLTCIARAIDVEVTRLRAEEQKTPQPAWGDEALIRSLLGRTLEEDARRGRLSASTDARAQEPLLKDLREIVARCAREVREHERSGLLIARPRPARMSLGLDAVLSDIAAAASWIRQARQRSREAVQPTEVEKIITLAELNVSGMADGPEKLPDDVRSALTEFVSREHRRLSLTQDEEAKAAIRRKIALTAQTAVELHRAVRAKKRNAGFASEPRLNRLVAAAQSQMDFGVTEQVHAKIVNALGRLVEHIARNSASEEQGRDIVATAARFAEQCSSASQSSSARRDPTTAV